MKVRVYTIEWMDTTPNGNKVKRIAAFDDYGAARTKAIDILKARTTNTRIFEHKEVHDTDRNGMMYDRLRVKSWKHWYQVTIKYHTAPPTYNEIKFW